MSDSEEFKPPIPSRDKICDRVREIMLSAATAATSGGQIDRDALCEQIASSIKGFLPVQIKAEVVPMNENEITVRDIMEEPNNSLDIRLTMKMPVMEYSGDDQAMRSHDRFSRQTCVPGVDQSKIDNASVLVVGAGGLGSPVILYLSAAGVGTINVYDPDYVDETNLHRQILYTDRDVGNPKAVATAMRLKDMGTDGWVSPHFFPSHPPPEYKGFLNDYAVILDCTDRWSSHDAVVQSGLASDKPVVHGSIQGLLGRVMVFRPGGACWRCLHPSEPSGVKDGPRGTLGPVCGVIGSMMAMEALKIILGWPPQEDRMSVYDARSGEVLSLPRALSEECLCRAQ